MTAYKKYCTAIILLLLAQLGFGAKNTQYIAYQSVSEHVFSKYNLSALEENIHLKLEKRPLGWFVAKVDYNSNGAVLSSTMVWHLQKEKFQKLDLEKLDKGAENNAQVRSQHFTDDPFWYKEQLYYGYKQCNDDIIANVSNAQTASQFNIYSLARAYSSKASNLLHNNSGLADTSKMLFAKGGVGTFMSASQLSKYREVRHKAIATFNLLVEKNPDYITVVGSAKTKRDNEHLTAYLDVLMFWGFKEAFKEIDPSNIGYELYEGFQLNMASNYLVSCPQNALLFTNGDNDTYPLIYAQVVKNIRRDVQVVNYSLLQTPHYFAMLKRGYEVSPPLQSSFNVSHFENERLAYFYLKNDDSKTLKMESITNLVKTDTRSFMVELTNGDWVYYLPNNALKLMYKSDTFSVDFNQPYMTRNQLLVYDIIGSEKSRPICFAITMGTDAFCYLQDAFMLRGLVYELKLNKKEENLAYDINPGFVNTKPLYNVLFNDFDYRNLNKAPLIEKRINANLRFIFSRLAKQYKTEEKTDSALIVLDACIRLLNQETSYYDFVVIDMANTYYYLGEKEKAYALLEKIKENVAQGNINPLRKDTEYIKQAVAALEKQLNATYQNFSELEDEQ